MKTKNHNGAATQRHVSTLEIGKIKIDPIVGGVLGAVAGAAIGSAAAAFLQDEKTRRKMMEQFSGFKKTLYELKEDEYIREKVEKYLMDGKKEKKEKTET
jgi:gas vesicle protein